MKTVSKPFKLTKRQMAGQSMLAGDATNDMLYGGSRSGKTFLILRCLAVRAIAAPESRHAVFRFRFSHLKSSVILDTWPTMMRLAFPDAYDPKGMNKSDWFYTFKNGSEVWFAGLDDKERTEKVLGMEFVSIFLNECSQIPWRSRNIALTRLAQQVNTVDGQEMRPRVYYDCNPPSEAHWTYRVFVRKTDPITRKQLTDPDDFNVMQMNPRDNLDNLGATYLKTLEGLPFRDRQRFLEGQFGDVGEGQLWTEELCDQQRHEGELPDMVRVVVAIDPSGASGEEGERSDEIGIIVLGLGTDGRGYVLEDLSGKMGPDDWGYTGVDAFVRHDADCVVGETNYGGAMVEMVIKAGAASYEDENGVAGVQIIYKEVRASRGKAVRAEPVSVLFETDKARFHGKFPELEDQCCSMTVSEYTGDTSPDRLDAMVWGFTELFPRVVRTESKQATPKVIQSRPEIRQHYNRNPQVRHRR